MAIQQTSRKGSNCPICDRPLLPNLDEGWKLTRGTSPRGWFQTHCESDHRDYLAWKKSNRRIFTILGLIGGASMISGVYLILYVSGWSPPTGQSRITVLPTLGLGIAGFALIQIGINRWGIRKFRREWMDRGGVPVASFDLNTSSQ